MIIVMMVSVIILEHYFEYHVAFGLLVASVIFHHDASWYYVMEYDDGDDSCMWILAG